MNEPAGCVGYLPLDVNGLRGRSAVPATLHWRKKRTYSMLRPMKALLIVATTLLLGLAGWLLASGGEEAGQVHLDSDVDWPVAPEELGSGSLAAPSEVLTVGADRVEAPVLPELTAVNDALVQEVDAAGAWIEGTLTIKGLDGREDSGSDGEVEFSVWRGRTGHRLKAQVQAGVFRTAIEGDEPVDGLSLRRVIIGGRIFRVLAPEGRFVLGGSVDVLVQEPRSYSLEVTDAETGAPLQNIRLVDHDEGSHPGTRLGRGLIAEGLSSPVLLDPYTSKLGNRLLVGATGYAWKLVETAPLTGGLQKVELVREARIHIEYSGAEARSDSRLRIRRKSLYEPVIEVGLEESGSFTFDGLPPDEYTIRAEVGLFYDSPLILAEAKATLIEGVESSVTLALAEAPHASVATLGGHVYAAKEWGFSDPMLTVQLLGTPLEGFESYHTVVAKREESDRAGWDAFAYSLTDMQAANYVVSLEAFPVQVFVELPPEGTQTADILVPGGTDLLVYTVDRVTQDPVQVDRMSWTVKRPEGVRGGSAQPAEFDSARGAYFIRAPKATISLSLMSWTHRSINRDVDLSSGIGAVTLELEPASGYVVRMLDEEGTPIAFPDEEWVEVTPVEGDGYEVQSQTGAERYRGFVNQPGTYAIKLPVPVGFQAPELQTIDVPDGEIVEVTVTLLRN